MLGTLLHAIHFRWDLSLVSKVANLYTTLEKPCIYIFLYKFRGISLYANSGGYASR